MDAVKGMFNMNLTVLKEPRGLIRMLQFVLSILAFATVCDIRTHSTVKLLCPFNGTAFGNEVIRDVPYSYPFRVQNTASFQLCNGRVYSGLSDQGWASSAEFFVFVGVMAFLLSLGFLILYLFLSDLYMNNALVPKVDLIVSAVWALLFFIASIAWAVGLNNLHTYMTGNNIAEILKGDKECWGGGPFNGKPACEGGFRGDNAAMIASCLFGFLNCFVWGGGLWFIFKETQWHKERADHQQDQDIPPATNDFDSAAVNPPAYQGGDVPPTNQF